MVDLAMLSASLCHLDGRERRCGSGRQAALFEVSRYSGLEVGEEVGNMGIGVVG